MAMAMAMALSKKYQPITTTTTTTTTTGSRKNDRSVFVMVSFETDLGGLERGILYEFKIKHGGFGEIIIGGEQVEQEQKGTLGGGISALHPANSFFAGLNTDTRKMIHFQCTRFCSSPKLHLVYHTLHCGLSFDTHHMSWGEAFTRPIDYYQQGPLIHAYGNLYYFADPSSYPHSTRTTFQRYDPTTDSWDRLPPCPFYSHDWKFHTVGYAVSRGCILFSLMLFEYLFDFLVFNISTQKWHKLAKSVSGCSDYFPFYGRAVVVDDDSTIYAATYDTGEMLVVKFSLRLPVDADDSYYIDPLIVLPGLNTVLPPPQSSLRCKISTYYMVHLGDFEFCLVYNYNDPLYRQNLCITTFRIVRDDSFMHCIKTLHSTVADFYLPPNNNRNHIVFSFTPDYDDDDTQSQEDKSATTVKPAKHKSVRAFDAKEVPSPPRGKRSLMDSEACSHMSSANRKEYSLKERSADRIERSHRKRSVEREEQSHDMTSIGRGAYSRRSSVDADREESYHKRGSRHREEHSHERNSISSRGERSHRRSSLDRKESSHKRPSRDREESSHKRSSTDGSHKRSFMDRKEHSQERSSTDKGEHSRKRSSVDREESYHRMNSMDGDAHSRKRQKHSSNSHRLERRRSSRGRF